MAIKVNHGVSPGAVAAGAFGGGLGAARQRAAIGAAQAATALEQQQNAIKARAAEAEAGRRYLDDRQAAAEAKLADEDDLAAYNAAKEGRSYLGLEADKQARLLEYSLTTKQKHELDNLAESEAQALASPEFTDEEKNELRYRFAQRRAGLQPVARPKKATPAELFQQRTHTDPKTGRVYALDENGMPGRAIYEPPERMPTVQDRVKGVQAALTAATNELGVVDEAKAARYLKLMGIDGAEFGAGGEQAVVASGVGASARVGADAPQEAKSLPDMDVGTAVGLFGEALSGPAAPGTPTAADPLGVKSLDAEVHRITDSFPEAPDTGSQEHQVLYGTSLTIAMRPGKNLRTVQRQLEINREALDKLPEADGRRLLYSNRVRMLEARDRELRQQARSLEFQAAGRRVRAAQAQRSQVAPPAAAPQAQQVAPPVSEPEPAAAPQAERKGFTNADLTPDGIERARALGKQARANLEARRQTRANESQQDREAREYQEEVERLMRAEQRKRAGRRAIVKRVGE